ncbi:MAG: YihY/virulence factor BrkB family protein [Paludibacteraceae bacterium]
MWRTRGHEVSTSKRLGLGTLKTIVLAVKGFNQNDINMRANSLTYSMMFAIVPIMALIIAVARGFGFESVIEDWLNQSFLSSYNIVPTIMGFVNRYLETAQGGAFLGIGLVILLWAVYSFFRNVESSMNKIWEVEQSRSIVRQFANYLTILIMVPILIVLSSGVSIFFSTHAGEMALSAHFSKLHEILLKSIPWLSTCLMLTLLYWIVPNTKVRAASAIAPGLLIGSIVYLLQSLSVYLIMFLSRTSIVYGTFAAIPLLLTWLQWTCLLILTGAELSYSIQNKEKLDFAAETVRMSRRYKDYLTLYICQQIIQRFEKGLTPLTANEIAQADNLPVRNINNLLSRLTEVKILCKVMPENELEEVRYQPAMDINKITVGLVISYIEQQGEAEFFTNLPEPMNAFWTRWQTLRKQATDYQNWLVKDL